eukprot:COSAG06_NODE_769_length_12440_cov_7.241796_13_plen_607_part_00
MVGYPAPGAGSGNALTRTAFLSPLKTDDYRAYVPVWPLPESAKSYSTVGAVRRCISSTFAVEIGNSRSGILRRGAGRYQTLLRGNHTEDPPAGVPLASATLSASSDDEWLGSNTSYSYTLDVPVTGPARLGCVTPFGCLYALESLAQALHPNGCIAPFKVVDRPQYIWRGMMLDVSSRFAPVQYILGQIRAMAMVKMNVLHLHLSEGTYRLPTAVLPLNEGVRHYTAEDVDAIVQYGRDRGVRVVPELDVPGHAMGFAPARNASRDGKGLRFCNDTTLVQLFADPGNATLRTLTALFAEATQLFPDEVFHLGGDETIAAPGYTGQCTLDSFRFLLQELQRVLLRLGKVPMGWNDLITRTRSALPNTIIDAWTGSDDNFTVDNATALGHRVVNSDNSVFYLMYQMGKNATIAWRDISLSQGHKLNPARMPLLLGGSVSVWTGDYARRGCLLPFTLDGVQHRWLYYGQRCSGGNLIAIQRGDHVCNVPCPAGICMCGNTTKYLPKASWMSADTISADNMFSESASRWTWPVASAAAGSFWRWEPQLPQQVLVRHLRAVTSYMARHGVATCPFDAAGCPSGCTYTHKCGVPYKPRSNDDVNDAATNMES